MSSSPVSIGELRRAGQLAGWLTAGYGIPLAGHLIVAKLEHFCQESYYGCSQLPSITLRS